MAVQLTPEAPSVQSYLTILQRVISRMASNSASSKTWCITLVSAIIVVVAGKPNARYVWIALAPVILFFFLDSYYLGLEQAFRSRYNDFIQRLHAGDAQDKDLFIVAPGGFYDTLRSAFCACLSPSVWPFYLLLVLMLVGIRIWVL